MSLKIEQRPQMNTISIKLSFFTKRHIFTCMYRVWNCLPLNKRVPAWYPGATYIKTYMKYNDVPTKCDRDDTRVKTHNLFRVDENSLEQCCAAHIVTPDCGLIEAQQCWTILLTTLNNVGSTTLFKVVFINPEQVVRFLLCRKVSSQKLPRACLVSRKLHVMYNISSQSETPGTRQIRLPHTAFFSQYVFYFCEKFYSPQIWTWSRSSFFFVFLVQF